MSLLSTFPEIVFIINGFIELLILLAKAGSPLSLCAGSRGDFQPYLALAMELKKLGKDVRITGMREFESFIRSYGIDFYPIQADFKSLNVDEKMLKEAQTADNPFKMLLTFNKMKKYGV